MIPHPLLLALAVADPTIDSADTLPPTIVLASRVDPTLRPIAIWEENDVRDLAPRSLDELLATDPSFSLYRPTSGIFANPTAAGVSLRNTGATAASRSLVTLDGIPQNDPFGGWVDWTRIDPWTLESASILPSSQSSLWGNLSAAGSIQLNSRPISSSRSLLRLTAGSHGTLGAAAGTEGMHPDLPLGISFHGFTLQSDGFHVVPDWQRGPIDRRLDTTLAGATLRAEWSPAPDLVIAPSFSFYEEHRGNGTPLAENRTEAIDASLRMTSGDEFNSWQLLTYYQRRSFSALFPSVNAPRTAETIALNQFHVPGEGIGAALIHRRDLHDALALTAGTDFRFLSGETQEDVGTFRRRRAGGNQSLAGLFAALDWESSENTRIDASLRIDRWRLSKGRRIERALSNNALLRADFPGNRDDWEPSAALGIEHRAHVDWLLHAALSSAFRLPNLNELHRPFRVRNDVTEANPALLPERFFSLESGIEWTPTDELTIRFDAFHHWIDDAIANVPVTDPAMIAAIFGPLPPGSSATLRQNVAHARVGGVQLGLNWQASENWDFGLDLVASRTRFTSSPAQPLLEGKPFPLAPELRLMTDARYQASDRWSFFTGLEYGASRFDDALATRELGSYTTVRVGSSWQVSENLSLHGRIENLFDEEIPTALAGDGTRSYGQPRAFWVTAEWNF
ncbi:MAG: TonB-dependent receptor [Akkermansiaceae bacterium]|jgi:outer membrane receptor protein involved in Fe transport|nr:TonB-dependent receptor [Akkermansiaceae bacterium]